MSDLNQNQAEEWSFLKQVYDLLIEENVLNTPADKPIVDFKFPDELQKILDLKITPNGIANNADIRQLCKTVIRYSVKTNHPHFHNQLFGGVDPYGLAGSWITDALNTSQYTFEVGPVFSLMENEVIQTFANLFGFEQGDGIFAPGGSISNMYGMVLGRYKAVPDIKINGCFNLKPLVAFTSDESHYSLKKSVHWLGIGIKNLVVVKTNINGCMLIDDLEKQIQNVIQEGRQPFFVNATAGTTVLGAFDDLDGIATVCQKHKLWMHVDACLGGSIILSSKHKHRLNGIHRADSIAWNPHKSMGVPLQCSLFLIKEKGLLHEANSAAANYLFQQDKFYDVSHDTGDKCVQCGRKVDVFKFWLMLKVRGLDGFEQLIDNAMDMTEYLSKVVSERKGFRLTHNDKFHYTNVCFWYIPKKMRGKQENDEWWDELYKVAPLIKKRMILCGSMMIGYTPLWNKGIGNFFRMTLACFPPATMDSIDFLVNEIERLGEE